MRHFRFLFPPNDDYVGNLYEFTISASAAHEYSTFFKKPADTTFSSVSANDLKYSGNNEFRNASLIKDNKFLSVYMYGKVIYKNLTKNI